MNATGAAPAPQRTAAVSFEAEKRVIGYGLPCAKCNAYFAADIKACPVCKCDKRVSPVALIQTAQPSAAAPAPDDPMIEEERQRFLNEYKSQLYSSNAEFDPLTESSICSQTENHPSEPEPASVCNSCFEKLRDRVDHAEAALWMDVEEASQVIYDAVWADASDPSQTYINAAQAVLSELRKRAGIKVAASRK